MKAEQSFLAKTSGKDDTHLRICQDMTLFVLEELNSHEIQHWPVNNS
tara:strand:+ start:22 stop:162 length:141 start_codon:yes stop_codon:yes gene_type:complete